nr:MAG TPA: hypothetical protein [Caudoviricetes sp.]DAQ00172.1 MAG TPA: hypothetical protein [Caudoviricetes sp.]
MDKIFSTMGFVCLPLIIFTNPLLSGFLFTCTETHYITSYQLKRRLYD